MATPFVPQKLPIRNIAWEPLIPLIGNANRALTRYDSVLCGLLNPQVHLAPLITQEAVLSSRIEGTRATLGDVLRYDAGEEQGGDSKQRDIQEIINYRAALRLAEHELETRPFNLNLLLKLHATLLDSVRGQDKARGRFRTIQNWIGLPGSTIDQAQFIPPDPLRLLDNLGNWEKYYHAEYPDPLVQLAVIHAQFEIIHPFLDGNGRLGRMLVPLYLYEKQILSKPVFYLSAYLALHRDEYIGALQSACEPGNWNRWIAFFLTALISQAAEYESKVRQIMALNESLKTRLSETIHSRYLIPLLDNIFRKPVFQASLLEFQEQPVRATLRSMLNKLIDSGTLVIIRKAAGNQAQVLAFQELITICEG